MAPEPNAPVLVGVGFAQEKSRDPGACPEPYQLMVRAVRGAAADAGSDALLGAIGRVSVVRGLWSYRNPGRLVAHAVGAPSAQTALAELGVLQLTPLAELCRAIAAGELEVGVVTGGEARYRKLRAQIAGLPAPETQEPPDAPPPDVHLTSSDPFTSELEVRAGVGAPVQLFAIIESALRRHLGLGIEEHRDRIARLYSGFSRVAAANPHAWRREALAPEAIRDPSPRNPMLAFPYTKHHASQWNVNRAVALLVCSAGKARELGLDPRRQVHPVSAAESRHVVTLARQRCLYSHAGTVLSGERALALAGVGAGDLAAADLYSCFPSAVQSFAHDLGLGEACPWTVTGSMAFAGGPFNHASLEGVARMAEVLRAEAAGKAGGRRVGLVSNLSGIFGKQACALFSSEPAEGGYAWEDVTDTAARRDPPLPLDGEYVGPVTVAGYTVVFDRGEPSHAVAVCDTPGGARTVVRSEDRALCERMTREEFCGRAIEVRRGGRFSHR